MRPLMFVAFLAKSMNERLTFECVRESSVYVRKSSTPCWNIRKHAGRAHKRHAAIVESSDIFRPHDVEWNSKFHEVVSQTQTLALKARTFFSANRPLREQVNLVISESVAVFVLKYRWIQLINQWRMLNACNYSQCQSCAVWDYRTKKCVWIKEKFIQYQIMIMCSEWIEILLSTTDYGACNAIGEIQVIQTILDEKTQPHYVVQYRCKDRELFWKKKSLNPEL